MALKEKYRFFGDRSDCNNHNVIVTAYSILDTETNILTVSYSFCSSKDKYNKAFGKKIAKNRHDSKPCMLFKLEDTSYITIDKLIRDNIVSSNYLPKSMYGIY